MTMQAPYDWAEDMPADILGGVRPDESYTTPVFELSRTHKPNGWIVFTRRYVLASRNGLVHFAWWQESGRALARRRTFLGLTLIRFR